MIELVVITLIIQTGIISYVLFRIYRDSDGLSKLENKFNRIIDLLTTRRVSKRNKARIKNIIESDEPESISILELSNLEARDFLLQENSYASFKLPPYIKFYNLITNISSKLDDEPVEKHYINDKSKRPWKLEHVNYKLMSNKDGKYDWRPFELVHPVLYVDMIKKLTSKDNWSEIVNRFDYFQENSIVQCESIPRKSLTEQSDQAENVTNWLNRVEKESVSLSIKYDYLYKTDISDCYGSVYTHSISWALYDKQWCKDNINSSDYKNSLGKYIETYHQNVHHQQTNGIPQGNVLSDLIAELVLGYIDTLFTNRLKKLKIHKHIKVIRYRDDYRIFTNEKQYGDTALKELSEILSEYNFKLSKGKTSNSNSVIKESIKSDKQLWKTKYSGNKSNSLIIRLMQLLEFSNQYPNSGTLRKELTKLHKKIYKWDYVRQELNVLIAYTVDIASKNPGCYSECSALLSKFISLVDADEREPVLKLTMLKLDKIPNNGYLEIWIQRILLKHAIKANYTNDISKGVDDRSFNIWDSSWLTKDFHKLITDSEVIDEATIEKMDEVIQPFEFELFADEYER